MHHPPHKVQLQSPQWPVVFRRLAHRIVARAALLSGGGTGASRLAEISAIILLRAIVHPSLWRRATATGRFGPLLWCIRGGPPGCPHRRSCPAASAPGDFLGAGLERRKALDPAECEPVRSTLSARRPNPRWSAAPWISQRRTSATVGSCGSTLRTATAAAADAGDDGGPWLVPCWIERRCRSGTGGVIGAPARKAVAHLRRLLVAAARRE